METTTMLDDQLATLRRGAEAIYSEEELKQKLASGRQLRIKLGMDPTAPDIHLGHSVVLRKLRQFQDLGHKAVLIIGDYTARIGDPTGRDTTRPVLDEKTILENAETYLDQAGRILDTSPEKLEVRRNSEWLGELSFADVLKLTGQMTVQQMLQRENFKLRMQRGTEILITEFMYPLMQAYDSVVIDADVELGGTDQTFNNLVGRELMAKYGKPRQVVIVMPILVGLDGTEKMSKSKGNYVGINDRPEDMYGKLMSIPDRLMDNYFHLLTPVPEPRISSLIDPDITHPREAKDTLARIIVEEFYDTSHANQAAEEFRRRFAEGQLPTDLEVKEVQAGEQPLANLINEVGFAGSNSEARRLIKQGAVSWKRQKVKDPATQVIIENKEEIVLQVGKRRVCVVRGIKDMMNRSGIMFNRGGESSGNQSSKDA